MEEALAVGDARWDAAILWTEEPEIYRRFGFAPRIEHAFDFGEARAAVPSGARALELDRDGDRALLSAALARRTPVSERAATREPGWHFLIDVALAGPSAPELVHVPELEAIAAIERDGDTLRVIDVVASRLPRLDDLVARIPRAQGAVIELATGWDSLSDRPPLASRPSGASDVLMVRGRLDVPEPFALSPLTRC
jgi:hypothetical protein